MRQSRPSFQEVVIQFEVRDRIDLLLDSGRTIDALRLDGWRVDVGYPEDRDRAEELLAGKAVAGGVADD